jgi:hypothetical protein
MMLHKHYVGIYQSSVARRLAKAPVDTVGLREEQGATLHKPWLFMSNP